MQISSFIRAQTAVVKSTEELAPPVVRLSRVYIILCARRLIKSAAAPGGAQIHTCVCRGNTHWVAFGLARPRFPIRLIARKSAGGVLFFTNWLARPSTSKNDERSAPIQFQNCYVWKGKYFVLQRSVIWHIFYTVTRRLFVVFEGSRHQNKIISYKWSILVLDLKLVL